MSVLPDADRDRLKEILRRMSWNVSWSEFCNEKYVMLYLEDAKYLASVLKDLLGEERDPDSTESEG